MGKVYDEIPDYLATWIEHQKIFWVATAPLSAEGNVNVSPKGFSNTFHIADKKTVWYEDLSGSGTFHLSLRGLHLIPWLRDRDHLARTREWSFNNPFLCV